MQEPDRLKTVNEIEPNDDNRELDVSLFKIDKSDVIRS
jgi:hypothetical protein